MDYIVTSIVTSIVHSIVHFWLRKVFRWTVAPNRLVRSMDGMCPGRPFKGICTETVKTFYGFWIRYWIRFELRLFDPGLIMVLGIGLIQKWKYIFGINYPTWVKYKCQDFVHKETHPYKANLRGDEWKMVSPSRKMDQNWHANNSQIPKSARFMSSYILQES